ncbi:MAG: MoaD/ThiS family protein [Candidatus Thorarchaeota archaeon]
MNVRFKSFGSLRRVIGTPILELEVVEGTTVLEVVEKVIEMWGDSARQLIMNGHEISGNMIILLNMKDVNTIGGTSIAVKPDDEIAILPHVQGG